MAIFYRQSLPWESLNNPKMTWILRAAVNLLCALPRLFYPPHWFAKPPPRFSVWDSGYANRSGPFVCTVCRMARAFCAVPYRFRPPYSFAKAPHQFPVCDYGNANRSRPYVFLNVGCGFFFFAVGWRIALRKKKWSHHFRHVSCCQNCEQALRRTYGWAPGPKKNYAIPIIQIIYLVTARSIYQTTLRYSGDSQTFVAAERKQDCGGLANKIQCLARKIATAWLLPTNARRDKSLQ